MQHADMGEHTCVNLHAHKSLSVGIKIINSSKNVKAGHIDQSGFSSVSTTIHYKQLALALGLCLLKIQTTC